MITPSNNSIISQNTIPQNPRENIESDSSRKILGQRREPNVSKSDVTAVKNTETLQKTNSYNNLSLNSANKVSTEANSFNRGTQIDISV